MVGLYLEILIAPITSVHMGTLWTKFHKKTENSYFWHTDYKIRGERTRHESNTTQKSFMTVGREFNQFISNF